MAGVILSGSNNAPNVAASATNYQYLTQGQYASLTTESQSSVTYRKAGVLSKLLIGILTMDRGSTEFRTRVGAASAAMTVSFTTTGEKTDNVNTDTVTAGTLWNTRMVVGTGGTTLTYKIISFVFSATTDTNTVYNNFDSQTYTTNAATNYQSLNGTGATPSTTVANAQAKFRTAGVLSNLDVNVLTNTRTTTTTVQSNINGSAGALTFAVLTTSTGHKEDNANSDTIADGDLVCQSIVFGASAENFRMRCFKFDFTTTNNKTEYLGGGTIGFAIAASTTYYLAQAGMYNVPETSEANALVTANLAFVASKLRCYVSANTIAGASPLVLRAGGASLTQSVSITGLTTDSWFEDTVNTDTITASQQINYMLTGGALGTSLTLHSVCMLVDYTQTGVANYSTNQFLMLLGMGT